MNVGADSELMRKLKDEGILEDRFKAKEAGHHLYLGSNGSCSHVQGKDCIRITLTAECYICSRNKARNKSWLPK